MNTSEFLSTVGSPVYCATLKVGKKFVNLHVDFTKEDMETFLATRLSDASEGTIWFKNRSFAVLLRDQYDVYWHLTRQPYKTVSKSPINGVHRPTDQVVSGHVEYLLEDGTKREFKLFEGYNENMYNSFVEITKKYMIIDGSILFEDGSWSEWFTSDDTDRWMHMTQRRIPFVLKNPPRGRITLGEFF